MLFAVQSLLSTNFYLVATFACMLPTSDPRKIQAAGLHNVYRITDKLMSGSSPDVDAGFKSLKELGVKTVISVDGAKPDIVHAHKYGLRYVHIPFGYDGIPRQQVLRLARAVRDLPGPIYIHCHHGVHRGPAGKSLPEARFDFARMTRDGICGTHRYGAFGRSGAPRSFASLCGIAHPARRRDETAERDHACGRKEGRIAMETTKQILLSTP
jgi:protein tyrosine phosphatase (PTP) superfamily phosphohydrolase (DUF442 family)